MKPRAAALALLTVALVAVLLVLDGSSGRYRVSAVFTDVRGLVEGAPVRAAGLTVGRVDSVGLDAHGLPRVRLEIDGNYRLRRGARAAMRTASLSGENNAYVSVAAGRGPPLAPGAVLRGSATTSPVQVDQALAALGPRTRGDLRSALTGLDSAVS
ncbi:MAG: phospholipid/cholesterol/gamma-HCH transport system substrate-binding protein, partial [Solirubrobacteraceae bacterium]|nr:phospholipid/cholesterol/gamma-HCH transport system substrate-binding protein [Solirubrobacteraceae bacterium]